MNCKFLELKIVKVLYLSVTSINLESDGRTGQTQLKTSAHVLRLNIGPMLWCE